jgi:hypothetical protein
MIKPTLVVSPAGTNNFTRGLLTNLMSTGDLKLERDSDGSFIGKDGLVQSEIADSPRFDYTHGPDRPPSILMEPARGNRFEYTEEFSQGKWEKIIGGTGTLPVVTINQGIAPDGNMSADRVQFDIAGGTTSGDYCALAQNIDNSYNGNIQIRASMSFYVKSFDGQEYDMVFYTRNSVTTFDFKVTAEWTRVDVPTYQDAFTNVRHGITLRGDMTSNTADILLWGAQFELNYANASHNGRDMYPTSYIYNTTPSGKLRNAEARTSSFDPAALGGLDPDRGSATILFRTDAISRDNNGPWFRLGGTSSVGRMYIYNASSGENYPYCLINSATGSVNFTTESEVSAVTFTWEDGGTGSLYVDGVKIGDTPADFDSSFINEVEFGGDNQKWEVFKIIFHDVKMTDEEVQETIGYDSYAELVNNYLYNRD